VGNISGKASGEIDTIIGQIDDAFSMPYYDISSRESRYISEFLIIISGRFTDNAKEKISKRLDIEMSHFSILTKSRNYYRNTWGLK
jgi:hypothetical protein